MSELINYVGLGIHLCGSFSSLPRNNFQLVGLSIQSRPLGSNHGADKPAIVSEDFTPLCYFMISWTTLRIIQQQQAALLPPSQFTDWAFVNNSGIVLSISLTWKPCLLNSWCHRLRVSFKGCGRCRPMARNYKRHGNGDRNQPGYVPLGSYIFHPGVTLSKEVKSLF